MVVDGGWWMVDDDGWWTIDDGPWTIDDGRWMMMVVKVHAFVKACCKVGSCQAKNVDSHLPTVAWNVTFPTQTPAVHPIIPAVDFWSKGFKSEQLAKKGIGLAYYCICLVIIWWDTVPQVAWIPEFSWSVSTFPIAKRSL